MKWSGTLVLAICAMSTVGYAQTLPTLPQATVDTTYPTVTGIPRSAATSAEFTQALADAQPGDEIVLQAGATFPGQFTLPAKTGGGWIVIRTSNMDGIPAEHSRVDPTVHASAMPRIESNAVNTPAIKAAPNATRYRLVGLEITMQAGKANTGNLVEFGNGGEQVTMGMPSNIVIDRSYIHGLDGLTMHHCVAFNAVSLALIDSYVSNCKMDGGDAQAVVGWNGPGPYVIVNNFLEGSGQSVMFGGADTLIQDLVPSDITVLRNTMSKRLSWKKNDPSWDGFGWDIKNLFELKNARRVLVDGNDFVTSWGAMQTYAITLTVRNQGSHNPWATVEDVTFRNNLVKNVGGGISLLATDNLHPSQVERRIAITNNIFDDVSKDFNDGALPTGAILFINGDDQVPGPYDLTFDHNTAFNTAKKYGIAYSGSSSAFSSTPNFTFTNNIVEHHEEGFHGDHDAIDTTTFPDYFPTGLNFTHNIIEGARTSGSDWSSNYNEPGVTNNYFPTTLAAIGFQNGDPATYRLAASSPFSHSATDGSAVGVDKDAFDAARTGSSNGGSGGGGLFTDDFNDNSFSNRWLPNSVFSGGTIDTNVRVAEANGRVEIGPLPTAAGTHYNGVQTAGTYDLTDAYAYVALVQAPATTTTAFVMFSVGKDLDNYYRIYESNGTLTAMQEINGVKTDLRSVPYVAASHRFLRIGYEAGSVVFQTAPDSGGVPGTWSVLTTANWDSVHVPATAVRFEMKAGISAAQSTAPGTVAFDTFVSSPASAPDETVLLSDTFSGSTWDSSAWSNTVISGTTQDTTVPLGVSSGRLQIGPLFQNTSGFHYNALSSVLAYDLTGGYAYVQVPTVPASGGTADVMFAVVNDVDNYYRMYVEQGRLWLEEKRAGVKDGISVAYSAANHAFWRIRHDQAADSITFDVAADNAGSPGDWTTLRTLARGQSITGVRVELKAGTWEFETVAPGTPSFDNVKVARP